MSGWPYDTRSTTSGEAQRPGAIPGCRDAGCVTADLVRAGAGAPGVTRFRFEADVQHNRVSVVTGFATAEPPSSAVRGSVRVSGSLITVRFQREPQVLGRTGGVALTDLSEGLAGCGLTLLLTGPSGPLAAVGHQVDTPRWLAPLTGGRGVRLGTLSALLRSLRGPRVLPVLPALLKRIRYVPAADAPAD